MAEITAQALLSRKENAFRKERSLDNFLGIPIRSGSPLSIYVKRQDILDQLPVITFAVINRLDLIVGWGFYIPRSGEVHLVNSCAEPTPSQFREYLPQLREMEFEMISEVVRNRLLSTLSTRGRRAQTGFASEGEYQLTKQVSAYLALKYLKQPFLVNINLQARQIQTLIKDLEDLPELRSALPVYLYEFLAGEEGEIVNQEVKEMNDSNIVSLGESLVPLIVHMVRVVRDGDDEIPASRVGPEDVLLEPPLRDVERRAELFPEPTLGKVPQGLSQAIFPEIPQELTVPLIVEFLERFLPQPLNVEESDYSEYLSDKLAAKKEAAFDYLDDYSYNMYRWLQKWLAAHGYYQAVINWQDVDGIMEFILRDPKLRVDLEEWIAYQEKLGRKYLRESKSKLYEIDPLARRPDVMTFIQQVQNTLESSGLTTNPTYDEKDYESKYLSPTQDPKYIITSLKEERRKDLTELMRLLNQEFIPLNAQAQRVRQEDPFALRETIIYPWGLPMSLDTALYDFRLLYDRLKIPLQGNNPQRHLYGFTPCPAPQECKRERVNTAQKGLARDDSLCTMYDLNDWRLQLQEQQRLQLEEQLVAEESEPNLK